MMPGKTPRLKTAQEALDAAIREFIKASDEVDYERETFREDYDEAERTRKLQGSILTHWAVAFSRTYWERDSDDPRDTTEYPVTTTGAGVRDDAMPAWMIAGLLRRAADVTEMATG